MLGLPDFQRGQIVGARLAGESIIETSQLLGVFRGIVSKVMTEHAHSAARQARQSKTAEGKRSSVRDRWILKRIVTSNKRTNAAKVTADLNQHLDSPVSAFIVRRYLHKQNNYGREAILKPLVADVNAKRRLQLCHTRISWSIDK
ncbi:uncharacterized protein TNCV_2979951 [Trichonephila clavipes]|nr:uncharacterized protein TNCV_2979951 [Trichonephila clavipes]